MLQTVVCLFVLFVLMYLIFAGGGSLVLDGQHSSLLEDFSPLNYAPILNSSVIYLPPTLNAIIICYCSNQQKMRQSVIWFLPWFDRRFINIFYILSFYIKTKYKYIITKHGVKRPMVPKQNTNTYIIKYCYCTCGNKTYWLII